MKNKLLITLVAVLVILNVGNFLYGYSNAQQVYGLKEEISKLSDKTPQYVIGPQGEQGITGNVGPTGAAGINAISFNTTVVKDIPLIGKAGDAGKSAYQLWVDAGNIGNEDDFFASLRGADAPFQQLRVNNQTGDLENKLSTWGFWNILIPCSELKTSCPGVQ